MEVFGLELMILHDYAIWQLRRRAIDGIVLGRTCYASRFSAPASLSIILSSTRECLLTTT